jgi:hypothetical protein
VLGEEIFVDAHGGEFEEMKALIQDFHTTCSQFKEL